MDLRGFDRVNNRVNMLSMRLAAKASQITEFTETFESQKDVRDV